MSTWHEPRSCVEFTSAGSDEGDQATDDDTLDGWIFFRLGDDSGFHAVRAEPEPAGRRSR